MTSKREQVLAALFSQLETNLSATVLRDEVLPEAIGSAGLIIMRDGDPGDPEVTLSPLRYHYEHRAELEVFVSGAEDRAALLDAVLVEIGAAIEVDRTLGGLCDWSDPEAPNTDDLAFEGADTMKAAIVPIMLHYVTNNPLT
jgi:hypothetical protein